MLRAPKDLRDLMVENLAYQWEVDSIASRSFSYLLTPFITNTEFSRSQNKFQEIEGTHAATYSEIVRLCISDPTLVYRKILENKEIDIRLKPIFDALDDLLIAGAKYVQGFYKRDSQELYNIVFKGYIAMYLLERIQFMGSFASTFITAEHNYFIGICKLIQKIAIDEFRFHARQGHFIISSCLADDPRAVKALDMLKPELQLLYNSILEAEYAWTRKALKGKQIVGLTADLAINWIDFNAQEANQLLQLSSQNLIITNPLKWMEHWLNPDNTQQAQQEGDNTNYQKVFIKEDLNNEVLEF